jgi:carbamoylphosphate synthase large subunit
MRLVSLPGVVAHRVPAAGDPAFLPALHRLALEEQIDLLIPTVSEELPVVAAAWCTWGDVPAVIGPAEAVHIANDKYLTSERLSRHAGSVPRYCLLSEVASAVDVGERVGWPCLTKPRVGRGGREVTVRREEDWAAISELDDRYILQEFASGTDYAPNLYLGQGGRSVAVVLEKTELKGGLVGNAVSVQRVDAPDVAEVALAAARALGLYGPLDVDVRRRAEGTPVVLEINARFGANVAHAPEVLDAMLSDWESTQ